MAKIYTARARVRHHEVDTFGCTHPAVYLRLFAHVAIEASAAAGFDSAWYANEGAGWIIRRTTFEIPRPTFAGDVLEVRTWVEDFRRVRSNRRYEIYDRCGARCGGAVTDWVFIDMATGKPRRIPLQMSLGFGVDAGLPGLERPPWSVPAAPHEAPRPVHRVRFAELDALGHVNNATYLDILVQAVLDVFHERRWPLERLVVGDAVPQIVHCDIEYLDAALYGDRLELPTWFAVSPDGLDVYQQVIRSDGRLLVQAATRWRWIDPATGTITPPPAGLVAALQPARAA